MDNNYNRTKALLNILIKKEVITQEEFDEEVNNIYIVESNARFIVEQMKSSNICSLCRRESRYPDCGAKESDYISKIGSKVLECKLYIDKENE